MSFLFLQYVDPGAGSLITQLLLSLFIGAGFYLLSFRRRIQNWLKGQSNDKAPVPGTETAEFEKPGPPAGEERLVPENSLDDKL